MKKTAFITGATSGIGKAIAARFAGEGLDIIITGRRLQRLEALKEEWEREYGVTVMPLSFDVRDREATEAAVKRLTAQHPDISIHILVNNAGLAAGLAPVDSAEIADWENMIDTNLKGLLYTTRAVLPLMQATNGGHIINIGSTAGKTVYANGSVYCATKFAVNALTQSMRIDLLPLGIKVTAINPGMAETEFSLVRFKGDTDAAARVYEGIQPLSAGDVADAAWYCAQLPPHVCINELTITCLAQADSLHAFRKPVSAP